MPPLLSTVQGAKRSGQDAFKEMLAARKARRREAATATTSRARASSSRDAMPAYISIGRAIIWSVKGISVYKGIHLLVTKYADNLTMESVNAVQTEVRVFVAGFLSLPLQRY